MIYLLSDLFREESRHDEETSLEEELIKKLTLTGHVFRNRVRKVIKDEFPGILFLQSF